MKLRKTLVLTVILFCLTNPVPGWSVVTSENKLLITRHPSVEIFGQLVITVFELQVNGEERQNLAGSKPLSVGSGSLLAIYREKVDGSTVPLPLPASVEREIRKHLTGQRGNWLSDKIVGIPWPKEISGTDLVAAIREQWVIPGTVLYGVGNDVKNNFRMVYLGQELVMISAANPYLDTYVTDINELMISYKDVTEKNRVFILQEPSLLEDVILAGGKVPKLLYGTAGKKEKTEEYVFEALESGFRGLDSANMLRHYNEASAALGLHRFKANVFMYCGTHHKDLVNCPATMDIFIQTRYTPDQDAPSSYDADAIISDQVKQSVDSSLTRFNYTQLGSLILYAPLRDEKQTMEAWQAMEKQVDEGRVRYIGISNFSLYELKSLYRQARIKPSFIQNRCCYNHFDEGVRNFASEHGIIYQGGALLATDDWREEPPAKVKVRAIAKKYQLSVPQLVFQMALRMGIMVLTDTTSKNHMKDDLNSHGNLMSREDFLTVKGAFINRF